MTTHERLLEAVTQAVEDLFCDQSVTPNETRDDLVGLRNDIDFKIGCLDEDIKREKEAAQ